MSWTARVLLGTQLGESYSCTRLFGCTEDAVVQDQVSDEMSSSGLAAGSGAHVESTASFWL